MFSFPQLKKKKSSIYLEWNTGYLGEKKLSENIVIKRSKVMASRVDRMVLSNGDPMAYSSHAAINLISVCDT